MPAPGFILALLLTAAFTLATWLQPRAIGWDKARTQSNSLLASTLGDARRMFANHVFTKADVYFHSGYYPSIFDQAHTNETHLAEQAGKDEHSTAKEADEENEDFLGAPHDWIERFGRNFFVTKHTHLANGHEREMLPWLQLAAELDPQQVEIYTVGAYWLREHLNMVDEAEAFLRDGLRANPDSPEILFELGRVYEDDRHDDFRAHNLWLLADRKLLAHEKATDSFDLGNTRQILANLGRIEEKDGDLAAAVAHLKNLQDVLPAEQTGPRGELQKQIAELTAKINARK